MDIGSFLQSFGKRVRDLRERRSWSQEELARRSGRHFTYIGRIERGEQNVTLEVLLEIAQALDTTPGQLFDSDAPALLADWRVTANDIVEAVSHGFRAQVDVKGKLAELMLFRDLSHLKKMGKISDIQWPDEDGKPDFIVRAGQRPIVVECKNARSLASKESTASPFRVEIQKTRNSKDGTPTRGYTVGQFDVLSVCLFNRTKRWEFLHIASRNLATRPNDPKRLMIMQKVPGKPEGGWHSSILEAMKDASA